MSDSAANFSFPHRTPVFTTILVLICFAAVGWLVRKSYFPRADVAAKVDGVRTPEDRKQILAEHRAREHEAQTTYGWVDKKAGIVRLPIDRAIELTARDLGPK